MKTTRSLPREGHEAWVQGDGKQQVTGGNGGHGQDGHKVGDAPIVRNKGRDGENDHANDEDEREDDGDFELFNAWLANSDRYGGATQMRKATTSHYWIGYGHV